MAPVRVLHVINQLGTHGGAETSTRELVRITEGPDVHHGVCVLKTAGSSLDDLRSIGVEVFPCTARSPGSAGHYRHVSQAMHHFDADVVHSTLFDANVAARLAARRLGVPALVSLVNTPYAAEARIDSAVHSSKFLVVRATDRFLSRRMTDSFHAITHAVADAATRDLGVPRGQITVIPRGRRAAQFPPGDQARRRATRRALGLTDDAVVLMSVGREEAQKGHVYLLDALARLVATRDDIVLLHAGRAGAQTPAIEARLAADARLAARVRRLGVRTDIADLLAASDVFVFPSLYEGLGGSLVEAMAVGVPIVAGDSPAVREVLDAGACGVLVPVAAPTPLARGISRVLDDRVAAAAMVAKARARFVEHYELSVVAQRMVRLWLSVASSRRAVAPQVRQSRVVPVVSSSRSAHD